MRFAPATPPGTTVVLRHAIPGHGRRGSGTAFVGSSNLSRPALRDGIEWNYRVVTDRESAGFREVATRNQPRFRA